MAKTYLSQDQSEEIPVYAIKGLLEVQFEDERLGIFGFNTMEALLGSANSI
jgi:hypothetical protein